MAASDDEALNELSQRLDDHINDFDEHRSQMQDELLKLTKAVGENSNSIQRLADVSEEATKKNSETIDALVTSTETLIDTWNSLMGAVKVLSAFGRFAKWASGFGALIALVSWAYSIATNPAVTGG